MFNTFSRVKDLEDKLMKKSSELERNEKLLGKLYW